VRTQADKIYLDLLREVITNGDEVTTRNSDVYTHWNLPNVTLTQFPLITLRKTAVMKAIREMEWFLSGNQFCPEHLKDWWDNQLSLSGNLLDGYSSQFRRFSMSDESGIDLETFDQVEFILNALKTNPNSRRLVMTVWNPGEMANITETNQNPNTPTCCHSIVVQFFARSGKLHMKTYQRSADMLLGVPHNWVQSWAMLMYFARHAGLKVGSMTWMWGDAHIYKEASHLEVVDKLLKGQYNFNAVVNLHHAPTMYDFKANDFLISGDIAEPVTTIRPKLL
jgi:thymidylate synthase